MKLSTPWRTSTRALAASLALALCGIPELAHAVGAPQTQEQQQPPAQTQNPPAQPPTSGQYPPTNNPDSAMPNPAQPPLKPVETLPEAPSRPQQQNQGQPPNSAQQQQQAPAGAGAAQAGATAGGAASKPAGNAIAPAKQHQTRSLLIKIGAVGGAAIAVGTIVGLSRATGSKPPGAK
jgi:hypothetical protein